MDQSNQFHPWVSRRRSLDWLFDGVVAAILIVTFLGNLWPLLPLVTATGVALRQWVRGRRLEAEWTGVLILSLLISWDWPELTAILSLITLTLLYQEMTELQRAPLEEEIALESEDERTAA